MIFQVFMSYFELIRYIIVKVIIIQQTMLQPKDYHKIAKQILQQQNSGIELIEDFRNSILNSQQIALITGELQNSQQLFFVFCEIVIRQIREVWPCETGKPFERVLQEQYWYDKIFPAIKRIMNKIPKNYLYGSFKTFMGVMLRSWLFMKSFNNQLFLFFQQFLPEYSPNLKILQEEEGFGCAPEFQNIPPSYSFIEDILIQLFKQLTLSPSDQSTKSYIDYKEKLALFKNNYIDDILKMVLKYFKLMFFYQRQLNISSEQFQKTIELLLLIFNFPYHITMEVFMSMEEIGSFQSKNHKYPVEFRYILMDSGFIKTLRQLFVYFANNQTSNKPLLSILQIMQNFLMVSYIPVFQNREIQKQIKKMYLAQLIAMVKRMRTLNYEILQLLLNLLTNCLSVGVGYGTQVYDSCFTLYTEVVFLILDLEYNQEMIINENVMPEDLNTHLIAQISNSIYLLKAKKFSYDGSFNSMIMCEKYMNKIQPNILKKMFLKLFHRNREVQIWKNNFQSPQEEEVFYNTIFEKYVYLLRSISDDYWELGCQQLNIGGFPNSSITAIFHFARLISGYEINLKSYKLSFFNQIINTAINSFVVASLSFLQKIVYETSRIMLKSTSTTALWRSLQALYGDDQGTYSKFLTSIVSHGIQCLVLRNSNLIKASFKMLQKVVKCVIMDHNLKLGYLKSFLQKFLKFGQQKSMFQRQQQWCYRKQFMVIIGMIWFRNMGEQIYTIYKFIWQPISKVNYNNILEVQKVTLLHLMDISALLSVIGSYDVYRMIITLSQAGMKKLLSVFFSFNESYTLLNSQNAYMEVFINFGMSLALKKFKEGQQKFIQFPVHNDTKLIIYDLMQQHICNVVSKNVKNPNDFIPFIKLYNTYCQLNPLQVLPLPIFDPSSSYYSELTTLKQFSNLIDCYFNNLCKITQKQMQEITRYISNIVDRYQKWVDEIICRQLIINVDFKKVSMQILEQCAYYEGNIIRIAKCIYNIGRLSPKYWNNITVSSQYEFVEQILISYYKSDRQNDEIPDLCCGDSYIM